jgi:hypothetical protein
MAGEALSNGTILRVQSNEPPAAATYAVIGGVEGFEVPGIIRDEIEVTALDSTAREYIADLPDTGESSFTLMLRKGVTAPAYEVGQQRLEALAGTGTIVSFQVAMPPALGSITYTCQGYVKQFLPNTTSRQAATATVTIRWTGAVTKA